MLPACRLPASRSPRAPGATLPMRVLLQLLYYPLALALAAGLVLSASSMADLHRAVAQQQGPEQRTERELKLLAESLSLGLYTGGSEAREAVTRLLEAAEAQDRRARLCAIGLGAASALFLLPGLYGLRRRDGPALRRACRDLLGVSGVMFVVGVLAPVLTVAVHKELPVIGETVLQHDTKSIAGTVVHLWALGSWVTAVILGLFSVLTPILKLLLSLVASGAHPAGVRALALAAVHHVGRWSMTDVFVVAVLLAFLASGPEGLTRASLGVGLYFFAGYAVLSQVAGHLLAVMAERGPVAGDEETA